MPQNVPPWDEPFTTCVRSAVHLELRDQYAVDYEDGTYQAWQEGRLDPAEHEDRWDDFQEMVAASVARGVRHRRLRVVSLPASAYIRYEYAGTPPNIKAGEDVRWVSRFDVRDLLLPAHDFWIFDDTRIRWSRFDGEGAVTERTVEHNPRLAAHLMTGYEQAWQRAVRHEDFKI